MSSAPQASAADIIKAGGTELSTAADLYGASIDRQIATAKHYPRNLTVAMATCRSMVISSTAIADSCEYALPRDGKQITGPSVRFAEILAYNLGNCRVEGRIVEIDRKHVTAQGIFHDLENNSATSVEVKRRITTRKGKTYGDDMIQTTCQAAISLARRNAILAGVPEALWIEAYEAAQQAKLGTKESLPQRISLLMDHFEKLGVAPQRVLDKAGYRSADEFTANKLAFMRSVAVAIKEGHQTIEEAFPLKTAAGKKRPTLDDLAEEPGGEADNPHQQAREDQYQAEQAAKRAADEEAPGESQDATDEEQAPEDDQTSTLRSTPMTAALEGAELKALCKNYLKQIERCLTQAHCDDAEQKISVDGRLPNTECQDLLDTLSARREELPKK